MEYSARAFDVEEGAEGEESWQDDVGDAVAGGVRDEERYRGDHYHSLRTKGVVVDQSTHNSDGEQQRHD